MNRLGRFSLSGRSTAAPHLGESFSLTVILSGVSKANDAEESRQVLDLLVILSASDKDARRIST
jgi:hypothetical protein